jgi:hypothetical protein
MPDMERECQGLCTKRLPRAGGVSGQPACCSSSQVSAMVVSRRSAAARTNTTTASRADLGITWAGVQVGNGSLARSTALTASQASRDPAG